MYHGHVPNAQLLHCGCLCPHATRHSRAEKRIRLEGINITHLLHECPKTKRVPREMRKRTCRRRSCDVGLCDVFRDVPGAELNVDATSIMRHHNVSSLCRLAGTEFKRESRSNTYNLSVETFMKDCYEDIWRCETRCAPLTAHLRFTTDGRKKKRERMHDDRLLSRTSRNEVRRARR